MSPAEKLKSIAATRIMMLDGGYGIKETHNAVGFGSRRQI